MSSLLVNRSLITSLSAPVSIMALMATETPDETLAMRTGMMGLITWSSALTVSVDVVAASHRVAAWLEGG